MFLEVLLAEVGEGLVQLVAHLVVGGGGQANPARLANRLSRAAMLTPSPMRSPSAFLDDVAQMNADADLDTLLRRKTGVAFGEPALHVDGGSHGLDHAAELDHRPVAGALDEPPVVDGDRRGR